MARKVHCVLLKREAEGLDYLPYPGELGKRIYDSISKEAWAQWVAHQTMLINENRLTPIEPKARAFLVAEMEKFLVRRRVGEAEGICAEIGGKSQPLARRKWLILRLFIDEARSRLFNTRLFEIRPGSSVGRAAD